MKRSMLCCVLMGLLGGTVLATETPRVAAPNPVVMPDLPSPPAASPALGEAPAPASEKVKQAYAAQKAAKAQARQAAAGIKQAKKAKRAQHVAKKAGRHQVKKAGAKRRMRHA